jgi:hypothetical protein
MELDAKAVLQVLKEKKIEHFYHANTVQTSCIFLQHGRLLSRGTVDEKEIPQTSQKSDALDKKYGIWYDIFLDTVDIHARAKLRNLYGPVLFVFDLGVLEKNWLSTIWITKKNPSNWKDTDSSSDRYFQSVEEFGKTYKKGDFGSTFILRSAGGVLRLDPHLKEIIVDDPSWEYEGAGVYGQTIGALRASAWQGGLKDISIKKRVCVTDCQCKEDYSKILNNEEYEKRYGTQTVKQFFFLDADVQPDAQEGLR